MPCRFIQQSSHHETTTTTTINWEHPPSISAASRRPLKLDYNCSQSDSAARPWIGSICVSRRPKTSWLTHSLHNTPRGKWRGRRGEARRTTNPTKFTYTVCRNAVQKIIVQYTCESPRNGSSSVRGVLFCLQNIWAQLAIDWFSPHRIASSLVSIHKTRPFLISFVLAEDRPCSKKTFRRESQKDYC